MKATELRIGNKFYLPNGKIGTITYHEIRLLTILQDKPNYKPIPLTEDILLKCGFEKVEFASEQTGYGTEYHLTVDVDINLNYAEDFSLSMYGNSNQCGNEVIPFLGSINTVHGLQNLYFALTGEELNVEL
jgi:hypothetical protein